MEIFVIFAIGLWFLFPAVLFMAMNNIDRYGEKLVELEHHHVPRRDIAPVMKKLTARPLHWPHFIHRFRIHH